MTKPVAALLELLEEGAERDHTHYAHLLGQVAAEVVSSSPTAPELKKLAAGVQLRRAAEDDPTPSGGDLQLAYSVLLGLFQSLQVQVSTSASTSGQGTVKERILFALAESPAGPTEIGARIGSATEVASRTLRTMSEQKLVRRADADGPADKRYHVYELTVDGEDFVDRRFTGDLATLDDDLADETPRAPDRDSADELRRMVTLARHINRHDPRHAANLGSTLERLKDEVDDRRLRAEAIGELCVMARSVKDLYGKADLKRWYGELMDMAHVHPMIAARAYYERGRWRLMYEPRAGHVNGALQDFQTARSIAESVDGDDRYYRLAWCSYQEAVAALHAGKGDYAMLKSEEAKKHFALVVADELEPGLGALACDVVIARALREEGKTAEASRILKSVVAEAKSVDYPRQVADAEMLLGRWEAVDGEDATEHLSAAVRSYEDIGNSDLAVEAKAMGSALRFVESNGSPPFAMVLKAELSEYSEQLRDDSGRYPPSYYWRLGALWRKVGIIASQLDDSDRESDDAFRASLTTYATGENFDGQTETLAYWWACRHSEMRLSPEHVREFVSDSVGKQASEHLVAAVMKRIADAPSGDAKSSDRWRLALLG